MKRKVLSLLLALTLCVGLAVPALAAEIQLKNPQTATISVPEIPGLTFTLENVFDEYAFLPSEFDDFINQTIPPKYTFFFPNHGTISCNQDIEINVSGSMMHDGIPISTADTRTLKAGEKVELNHRDAGRDAPAGKEFIFRISVYLEGAHLSFTENDDSAYSLFASSVEGNEVAKPISQLSASAPAVSDTPSTWATEQVNAAIAAGIVPEALQSKYTTATTRAEFCALAVALYETATGKEIAGRSTFSDTTDVNVQKMAFLGVVAGVGDNKFSPDSSLTREQAATMLSRLAGVMDKPMPEQAPTFADNGKIGSWAYDAVGHVQAAGIMSGVGDNQFSPSTAYTREQSIITMLRMFDYVK